MSSIIPFLGDDEDKEADRLHPHLKHVKLQNPSKRKKTGGPKHSISHHTSS